MKLHLSTILSVSVASLLGLLIGATTAHAGPDQFGSEVIEEPNGFPGVNLSSSSIDATHRLAIGKRAVMELGKPLLL